MFDLAREVGWRCVFWRVRPTSGDGYAACRVGHYPPEHPCDYPDCRCFVDDYTDVSHDRFAGPGSGT